MAELEGLVFKRLTENLVKNLFSIKELCSLSVGVEQIKNAVYMIEGKSVLEISIFFTGNYKEKTMIIEKNVHKID